jgi:hypothetical protein
LQLSWRKLNDQLSSMTEDEVFDMLSAERRGARRATILERLHQRYSAMRASRERIEIMKEATLP